MVPLMTKRPASFPSNCAEYSSNSRTVGSPSRPSSPTLARAMASRISSVGSVIVSLRKSSFPFSIGVSF
jgi:phospholipid N-methyltransferase